MAWNDLTPREQADTLDLVSRLRDWVGEQARAEQLAREMVADFEALEPALEAALGKEESIPHDGPPGSRRLLYAELLQVLIECYQLGDNTVHEPLRAPAAGPGKIIRIAV